MGRGRRRNTKRDRRKRLRKRKGHETEKQAERPTGADPGEEMEGQDASEG